MSFHNGHQAWGCDYCGSYHDQGTSCRNCGASRVLPTLRDRLGTATAQLPSAFEEPQPAVRDRVLLGEQAKATPAASASPVYSRSVGGGDLMMFGMTEAFLVMGLAAIAIIGGLVLFGNAQLSVNTDNAAQALAQIASAADTLEGDTAVLANEVHLARLAGVEPTFLEGVDLVLPYGGDLSVTRAASSEAVELAVVWDPRSQRAAVLCERLAAPEGTDGVLDLDRFERAPATDCNAGRLVLAYHG